MQACALLMPLRLFLFFFDFFSRWADDALMPDAYAFDLFFFFTFIIFCQLFMLFAFDILPLLRRRDDDAIFCAIFFFFADAAMTLPLIYHVRKMLLLRLPISPLLDILISAAAPFAVICYATVSFRRYDDVAFLFSPRARWLAAIYAVTPRCCCHEIIAAPPCCLPMPLMPR